MFVPSLSWQNDHLHIKNGQQAPFPLTFPGTRRSVDGTVRLTMTAVSAMPDSFVRVVLPATHEISMYMHTITITTEKTT